MLAEKLARVTDLDLRAYLSLCAQYVSFDVRRAYALARVSVRNANKPSVENEPTLQPLRALESRWYESLRNGTPDYTVYDDPNYLADLWACWVVYSRSHLRAVVSPKSMGTRSIVSDMVSVRRVVDLGCGFGYTTAALAAIFPMADVVGTNIENTCQYQIASEVARRERFRLVPDAASVGGSADLVFASEYFEHIERPIEHLYEVLAAIRPRYLLLANTFSAPAIGHFPTYRIGTERVANKLVGRRFNAALTAAGYIPVETRCWNSRPAYWKRK